MIAHDTTTHSARTSSPLRRSRAATIALWVAQMALAAMFLLAGGSKLAGSQVMVDLFAAIGLGQWFRYVTGAIEIVAAVALLIPSAALFGAILILPTMLGAAITNLLLGQSPAVPLALLIVATAIAWIRRTQFRRLSSHSQAVV